MTGRSAGVASALVVVLAVAACGSGSSEGSGGAAAEPAQSSTRCYELVQGSSRTVIKVEPAPGHRLLLRRRRGGIRSRDDGRKT